MKKYLSILLILTFTLIVASCGGNDSDDDSVTIETLIVYTNQTTDGRGPRLESLIKEANFPFDVVLVELSGQNLKNRLIAEKNAPIADVVLGGSEIEHLELKKEEAIIPYTPSWLDKIDDAYKHDDNYFSPWAIEPLYIAFNKAHFTNNADEVTASVKLAPQNWEDLATNFKGKYNVFKPSSGSGAAIYASILSKYRDDNGEYGVSEEGWNLLKDLIRNGILDRGLWQFNLAGSTSPIAMAWAGAVLAIEEAYSVELDIVVPEEGVTVVVSQVAVVNTKNKGRVKGAEQFIEWWGKTETQVAWANISKQALLIQKL